MSSPAVAIVSAADPPAVDVQRSAATSSPPPLFSADVEGEDSLGRAASARLLADLAMNPAAGTPFLVAVHGSAGSGKSSFLRQIVDGLRSSAQAAQPAEAVLAARIKASAGADAGDDLLAGLYAALRPGYAGLADDAIHAGDDPLRAVHAANDRVADLRRQLDAERQALDDIVGRQSNLVDTVLFNTPGSRIDGYARAHRASIEGRLRAFGLASPDPVTTYKDLVRETAESSAGASRYGMTLRALWAFKGQGTLIVIAVLLFLVGWACGYLGENQDLWVNWLNGLGDKFAGLSGWAQDHAGWLSPMSHAAFALATLAVLIDILRAFRFIQPVLRGASLLSADVEARRRDIDGLLAHQTRRVDHLAGDVETAVGGAEAAEHRAESRRAAGLLEMAPAEASAGFTASSPPAPAEAFLAAVQAAMGASGLRRIVVAVDDLDHLPPKGAAAYLDAIHRLLRRPGFVTIVAADRSLLLEGFSETDPAYAAARLGRCVQLGFDLDAEAVAAMSLRLNPPASGESLIDLPWQEHEGRLLRALMVFAGPNPRAVKRFANTYRVARADPKMAGATPAESAGLALALALDDSGAAAELGAYEAGVGRDAGGRSSHAALDDVVAVAQAALAERFTAAQARRGVQVARIYSRRG